MALEKKHTKILEVLERSMKNNIKDFVLNKRFIKYSAIGVSGVTLDVLTYSLLVGAGVPPVIATIFSTSLGIANNFLLNILFNFKKRDRILVRFIKFYGVGLVGIFITTVLIYLLHNILGVTPLISKLITIPPVVIVQFLLNKNVSFSDRSVRKYLHSLMNK